MHRKYPDLQRSPLDLRPPINLTFNRMEELRDRYHITSSLNGMKSLNFFFLPILQPHLPCRLYVIQSDTNDE